MPEWQALNTFKRFLQNRREYNNAQRAEERELEADVPQYEGIEESQNTCTYGQRGVDIVCSTDTGSNYQQSTHNAGTQRRWPTATENSIGRDTDYYRC